MSKEYLEALEPSVVLKFIDDLLKRYENKTDYNIYITKDWLLEIKQALKRLEAIENANPSVALECLEKICVCARVTGLYKKEDEDVVKQALLKAQKEHTALEIIKEKDVDIYILRKCKTVDEYNFKIVHIVGETRELTKEEFDLLKEVLENETIKSISFSMQKAISQIK